MWDNCCVAYRFGSDPFLWSASPGLGRRRTREDFSSVLGVSGGGSQGERERADREKASASHPVARETFKKLQKVKEVPTDEE